MNGHGHGEKQSRKREAAIAALLQAASVEAAAGQVGVAPSTLRRWLQQPDFAREYRAAGRATLEHAIGLLQRHTTLAVATLLRNCGAGAPEAVQVRAALGILAHAVKGVEVLDLETRLTDLEAAAQQHLEAST